MTGRHRRARVASTWQVLPSRERLLPAGSGHPSPSTAEVGRNVTEAAKGSGDIASNLTGVASAAQSTSSGAQHTQQASGELARMAAELSGVVSRFRIHDGGIGRGYAGRAHLH